MAKKEIEKVLLDEKDAKLKALQSAMSKIEKDFGKGSIMKLGDEHFEQVDVIPTGSISLNHALGVGGYPRGRIIELLLRLRRLVALQPSLMRSMRLTASMPRNWVWMSTTC